MSIDNDDLPNIKYNLTIKKVEASDTGNYTCVEVKASDDSDTNVIRGHFFIQPVLLPRIVAKSPKVVRTKISQSIQLYCVVEAHPLVDYLKTIKWTKDDEQYVYHQQQQKSAIPSAAIAKEELSLIQNRTTFNHLDKQRVNVTLDIIDIFKKDNGSYSCRIETPYEYDDDKVFKHFERVVGTTSVLVLDVPQVSLDFVKAVGATQIFMNWTTNDGNSPVKQYSVQHMMEGLTTFTYYNHAIDGRNLSYVLNNFAPKTSYQLKIAAENSIGWGPTYIHPQSVKTLEFDPVFVPEIGVKGNTHSTITIGWHPPPSHLLEYIHYYELVVAESNNSSSIIEEAIHPQNSRNLPYMFDNVS